VSPGTVRLSPPPLPRDAIEYEYVSWKPILMTFDLDLDRFFKVLRSTQHFMCEISTRHAANAVRAKTDDNEQSVLHQEYSLFIAQPIQTKRTY